MTMRTVGAFGEISNCLNVTSYIISLSTSILSLVDVYVLIVDSIKIIVVKLINKNIKFQASS